MARILSILLVLSFAGCGDDDTPAADGGSPLDAAPPADAATDAETPDAGSEGCPAEPCRIAWETGPSLPEAFDHHTTAVMETPDGPWLVTFGGVHTESAEIIDVSPNIWAAPIRDDGSLDEWVGVGAYGSPLAFQAQVAEPEGPVILLGGISSDEMGPLAIAVVLFHRFDAEGELTVEQGTGLPAPFRHATAHRLGETLTILGGLGSSGPQATVMQSPLTDGTNGAWEAAPALPAPRSHHASVLHDGRIYVFGGFDGDEADQADILRSTHDAAGALTGWEVVGTWDEPRWTASPVVHDGHVYLIGGGRGQSLAARNLATVVRAELTDSGIGPFEEVDALPQARSHVHQAPLYRGVIYSVGGRTGDRFDSTDAVHIGRLESP